MLAQVAPVVSASETATASECASLASTREPFAIIQLSVVRALAGNCTRSAILIYNALATHADPTGHCWPGRARLADITGLSERQVSRATAELERKGLLAKEGLPAGRVDYWLLPAPVTAQTLPPDTGVRWGGDTGVTHNRPANRPNNREGARTRTATPSDTATRTDAARSL